MHQINYEVQNERFKDYHREAQNERLVRDVQANKPSMLRNARQALGKSLIIAGENMLR